MNEKPQFDASLGGSVDLPPELDYVKYVSARNREVQIMKANLSQTGTGTKLAFQRLPKHMRRRAMSHNVKRLPRRVREAHLSQLRKSGNGCVPAKAKRSSRKYKRRPNNLQEDYARRRKKHMWLSTHIWHAKRFHMVEKWGYKLPDRPCDKAFRACYRATRKHCLLQDVSYNSPIQIEGKFDSIVKKFKLITNGDTGLSVGAKAYANGSREGTLTVFNRTKRAVGEVSFLWNPCLESTARNRVLWLWVPAAYYDEILTLLLQTFKTDLESESDVRSNNAKKFKLSELRCELSRFRLTGPLSNAVLQNGLKFFDSNNTNLDVCWFDSFIEESDQRQTFSNQKTYWDYLSTVKSVTELAPHRVISATVADPRFNFPKTRTKALPDFGTASYPYREPFDDCSCSVLWDSNTRKLINGSKLTNAQIAEARSRLLVPGTDLDGAAPVPVLLIQRPGCKTKNLGYGSGWDVVVPSAWAQPFWISLVMWGARAGGLRETRSIAFEMGQLCTLQPDTDAGKSEEERTSNECRSVYFKRPTNKRVNYNKLSIACPLNWNWELLLKNWTTVGNDGTNDCFVVMRDKKLLNALQESLIKGKTNIGAGTFPSGKCLVPVRLVADTKGLISRFAIICLPVASDFNKKEPLEPLKLDTNQEERKRMRCKHKELLKRLKQRRTRARRKGKVIAVDVELLKKYQTEMRKLWLPEATNIRNSCSRQVMGFVKHGDFSFTVAKSSAIGYVALNSLQALAKNKRHKNKVLVRNTNSRQYRLVTMEIITE